MTLLRMFIKRALLYVKENKELIPFRMLILARDVLRTVASETLEGMFS